MGYLFDPDNWEWLFTGRNARFIVEGFLVMPDGKVSTDRGAGAAGRADDTALPGANKLLSWVPGRGVDSHRADIGKRIPAGKYINWQIHYNPIGKATTDRTRLESRLGRRSPACS